MDESERGAQLITAARAHVAVAGAAICALYARDCRKSKCFHQFWLSCSNSYAFLKLLCPSVGGQKAAAAAGRGSSRARSQLYGAAQNGDRLLGERSLVFRGGGAHSACRGV